MAALIEHKKREFSVGFFLNKWLMFFDPVLITSKNLKHIGNIYNGRMCPIQRGFAFVRMPWPSPQLMH